jgi:hypothetical protein
MAQNRIGSLIFGFERHVDTLFDDIAQEVLLGPREGLDRRSVANCDNVHVVSKHRLSGLSASRVWEVKRALGYALDWAELKVLQGSIR